MGINSGERVSLENLVQSGSGIVTDGDKVLELIADPCAGKILRITRINIAVAVPATGGNGLLAFSATGGDTFHTMDADSVKETVLDYGELGFPLAEGLGLTGLVASAVTNDASVSISAVGYLVHA